MGNFRIVIPARSGSKSIPNKNLSIVGGKPLIVRSLEHAIAIDPNHKPILSSDSFEYADIANEFLSSSDNASSITLVEGKYLYEFPSFLFHLRSDGTSGDGDTIPQVLNELGSELQSTTDTEIQFWLVLQPTSPFRSEIDYSIWRDIISTSNESSSVVSFVKVDDYHPARMYLPGPLGNMLPLGAFPGHEQKPRQQLPQVFLRDGAFYLIGSKLVASQRQFSDAPLAIIREFPWTVNVDSLQDLILAQALEGQGLLFEEKK